MGTLLMFSALVLSGFALCNGQGPFTVTFQMSGITGSAVFAWASNNLSIALTVSESLGTGPVGVEIRPIWVDYDVSDKCSTAQLGAATSNLTRSVNFTNNVASVVFANIESLASLGGHSILLNGSSKYVCASIESAQGPDTAVAQFQDLIQGTVYFRQSISPFTRVVTDLYSSENPYSSSWFISNTVATCQLISSSSNFTVFNPNSVAGNACSKTSQESCAVGELSGKLGNVTIGGNKGENKFGYTDKNLPSIKAINGTLLLIKTSNGSLACAMIKVFTGRKGIVEFNQDGVTGSVTFSQPSPFDPTTTVLDLKGLNSNAKGYHIHLWPTPTKIIDGQDLCGVVAVGDHLNQFSKDMTGQSYPTPDNTTDDMYAAGDLSGKYGTLATKFDFMNTYTDWNLPLYGTNSPIGRSLVIHRDDSSASRWVCANIVPYDYSVVAAIAVLKYPVIGQIIFIQGERQSSETSIFAKLDYNDGRSGTKNHKWGINTNQVSSDMLSTNEASRCISTGSVYDPQHVWHQMTQAQYDVYCSKNSPLGCKTGDLSGRLGSLDIRNTTYSDTATRNFFTDLNLPLSGPNSIIGKSVFIMNEAGTKILACANIQPLHDPYLIASFSMGGIGGTISFKQKVGFGAMKTTVTNDLTLLGSKHRLYIYELPSASNSMCSDLGGVYNPLNITQNASLSTTDDRYMIGDLARKEISSMWISFNLPLTGLASINQRSLVVVDQNSQNKVVACAKIITAGSSPIVEGVSTFTGAVIGTIHLLQTINEDGTMSDTSILLNLTNQDGHKSFDHNWHEHSYPVQGDADAKVSRCNSTKGHIDPYMTMPNGANYPIECKPENPLRCEMGDQASKLGVYNLGEGRKMYTDVDLPLTGEYSGLGRSMVVHETGKILARLDCADIIPVTSDSVAVEIKSATNLNKRDVAQVYAKAIMANATDVVVEFISESNEISKIQVHFLGFQRTTIRSKFLSIINSKDKSSLSPYIPYVNAACYRVVSTTLLLAVLAVQLLNYL